MTKRGKKSSPGRSYAGFTLIECLAALGVFASIILLWQPIVHTAKSLTSSDEEMTGVMAGARELEKLTEGGVVKLDKNQQLEIDAQNGKHYIVNWFSSRKSPSMVRVTTDAGGFMPLMRSVQSFKATQIADGYVEYKLQTNGGKWFTSILASNGGEEIAQKKR